MKEIKLELIDIVKPLSVREFADNYFGVEPYFSNIDVEVFGAFRDIIGPPDLSFLLQKWKPTWLRVWSGTGDPDFREVSVDGAVQLFQCGNSIYFHIDIAPSVQSWFNRLCSDLGVPSRGQVSLIISPRGSGIRPHFDGSENLTIQLYGNKNWNFSCNNIIPWPTCNFVPGQPAHSELLSSTSCVIDAPGSMSSCLMTPGSVMHLPRGFWHDTKTVSDVSVSLNILIPPLPWADLIAKRLRYSMLKSHIWRENAFRLLSPRGPSIDTEMCLAKLLDDLKNMIAFLEPEDFIPKLRSEVSAPKLTDDTSIEKCELAHWYIEALDSGKQSARVKICSSLGLETGLTLSEQQLKMIRVISGSRNHLLMRDVKDLCPQVSTKEAKVLLNDLWYAGFVKLRTDNLNISANKNQEVS
jgi:50S ribosomal protein L16 3-hydroxylase